MKTKTRSRPRSPFTKERGKTIGIDIGGTKIAAGVVSPDGAILDSVTVATPEDGETGPVIQAACEVTDTLRSLHPDVSAIGVGAAGMVEWPGGRIRWGPNTAYRDLRLDEWLTAHTGLPAIVENDANAAAVAEARFGAGAGFHTVVVLTIGTGIGGGIILGNQLYRGPEGIAAEVGHIHLDPRAGPECGCGATGCLESLASGGALTQAARATARNQPDGMIARIAGTPEAATGETVYQAAMKGDQTAHRLFTEMGYWIGIGIASLVNLLNPQIVVLGGGIPAAAGDLLIAPARSSFRQFVFAADHRELPAIVPAHLGPEAGVIGAAIIAADMATTPEGSRA